LLLVFIFIVAVTLLFGGLATVTSEDFNFWDKRVRFLLIPFLIAEFILFPQGGLPKLGKVSRERAIRDSIISTVVFVGLIFGVHYLTLV
jgi:hypothetical protein